jgi:prepilin-type N-terminal cleavage/methylation domain-containing protein
MMRQKGFTIIELIVAVSIVSVIGLLVIGFLTDGSSDSLRSITRTDLQYQSQAALDIANKDIKYATGATTNNIWPDSHSPGAPGNLYSWVSDGDTLVLASPATNASGAYLYADAATYLPHKNNIIYFIQSGNLYRRIIAAAIPGNSVVTTCPQASASPTCPADMLVSSDVSGFTVSYLDESNNPVAPSGAHALKLDLQLREITGAQTIETSYTIHVVFRNG